MSWTGPRWWAGTPFAPARCDSLRAAALPFRWSLGPARGPARPAPRGPSRLDPGAVVGAPARTAPARAREVGGEAVGRVAPRGAAPARARVVDRTRAGVDERVGHQAGV